jgi:hypothetical protein
MNARRCDTYNRTSRCSRNVTPFAASASAGCVIHQGRQSFASVQLDDALHLIHELAATLRRDAFREPNDMTPQGVAPLSA